MPNSMSAPPKVTSEFRRVAVVFAGGPAPAANAVISTCAAAFSRSGIQTFGIRYGYSKLARYSSESPLVEGKDYMLLDQRMLKRSRNTQGILIGTARTNPGKNVHHPSHFNESDRVEPLKRVYEGLCSINVDALISIGGDDTLKTANKLKMFQDRLPLPAKRIPIVHVPKTIDNDYHGIDFTFGYFTAVDVLAREVRNLLYDAEASGAYFLAETMGRSAGWLAYGTAIAGEASLVISVEDVIGEFRGEEISTNPKTGEKELRAVMRVEKVVNRIVRTMIARERDGKEFGVIVMAEGLAEYLPIEYLKNIPRDDHGHISISQVELGRLFSDLVATEYKKQTGKTRRVIGLQLGYESRCAEPNAFDVMLGSQLGVGAYRALVEHRLNGVMVSVCGQLQLHYEPFEKLVDPQTLVTNVRYIEPESDIHKLARFLETEVNE
jgi:6-phosphofructokinase 1